MMRYNKGWKFESERHSLAARKVKTGRKPKLVIQDMFGRNVKNIYAQGLSETVVIDGKTYKKKDIVADGEVYNVKEKVEELEHFDESISENIPDDWYEYEVWLIDKNSGEVITGWDSLIETYDGLHKLSEDSAQRSMLEVINDVKKGKIKEWF